MWRVRVDAGHHLGEKEGTPGFGVRVFATKRATAIKFPVPQGEDQNVCDPQSSGGTEQSPWRFGVLGNPPDKMNQGDDHREGDDGIAGKSEGARNFVVAAAIGDDDGNHQDGNEGEKTPAGADGERFRKGKINAGGRQHGDKGGPTGFAKALWRHVIS